MDNPDEIPVVYIAGPYRAATRMEVHKNIRRAEEVGAAVMRMGCMPLIPHANTAFCDGAFPDEHFLNGDLALLARCDAIVLCPWWEYSEGTCVELKFANLNDIPSFDLEEDRSMFALWIDAWKVARAEGVTA